jgi:hypothetical protein
MREPLAQVARAKSNMQKVIFLLEANMAAKKRAAILCEASMV